MDERIAIPVSHPRHGPTRSYWQQPVDDIANHQTTSSLPSTSDVVIIGSGISGSSIAYHLLSAKPNSRIVLLEARQAASGASGRNGGHTKHASYRTFAENVDKVGVSDAIKIAQLEYDCMTAVHDFIRQNEIACDNRQCDTVDVYYDQSQLDTAHESVALLQEHLGCNNPASRYIFHDAAATESKFLTPDSLGSLQYEAGSLNAYRLTIGILKLALSKGLNLQCSTPANSIQQTSNSPSTWRVTTPRGAIDASTLILATNGYTANIYPELQSIIVPFRGIVTAHRPGLKMPQSGLETTYSFVYSNGYEYMISQPEGSLHHAGDIVIGGGLTKGQGLDGVNEFGNTDDTVVDPKIEKYLSDSTAKYFGKNWGVDHQDGRIRQVWSGIMGYSADGYPFVGPVPGKEGLWIDASFQGHGMVLCFLCAKALSQMVCGDDGNKLDKWFPKCYRVSEVRLRQKFEGLHHGGRGDAGRAVNGAD